MECREFFGRDDDLEVVKVRSLLPLVVAVVKDVLVSGEESLVLDKFSAADRVACGSRRR
ncbi:MAG: hypothetical protein ACJAQ9_002803 [Ilumatobacter sp.]|jgi:hypothetical protein